MSQVWTLWNSGSKGQRSRSQCKDYWKWFQAHNCFPFTPILMKLHMRSPHESSMCPMKFGVKRSKVRSQCKDYWKWFQAHNCFPFTPILMKLHMQSPHESSMDPMKFGVKRSKVKVTMQGLLKMVFRRITASPLHLSSWNFTCSLPMSQVWALWNSGSKGQRSRSQCKNYWKWFQAHNCFPFSPILMKLYMQSPHESSMFPMKFGVKRSKVKVEMQELLKMVSGA